MFCKIDLKVFEHLSEKPAGPLYFHRIQIKGSLNNDSRLLWTWKNKYLLILAIAFSSQSSLVSLEAFNQKAIQITFV